MSIPTCSGWMLPASSIATQPSAWCPVRGHQGLLFPLRQDNEHNGVIWEERPGLVVQVLATQHVADQLLLDVAAGLRITQTPAGTAAITVGPRPGWIKVGAGTK